MSYSIVPTKGGHFVRFSGLAARDHFVAGAKERAERSARAHISAHASKLAKPTPTVAQSKRELARLERELAELRGPSAAETARAAQKLELDRRMGLVPPAAMQSSPFRLVLGASSDDADEKRLRETLRQGCNDLDPEKARRARKALDALEDESAARLPSFLRTRSPKRDEPTALRATDPRLASMSRYLSDSTSDEPRVNVTSTPHRLSLSTVPRGR